MQIVIRPFEKSDIDPVYFLDQRASAAEERVPYARLISLLLEPEALAFVGVPAIKERPQPAAAILLVHPAPALKRLTIRWLLVDPMCRRNGIAKALVTVAECLAQQLQADYLAVYPSPDPATEMVLKALGFVEAPSKADPGGDAAPGEQAEEAGGESAPLWRRPVLPRSE